VRHVDDHTGHRYDCNQQVSEPFHAGALLSKMLICRVYL
jgi:hypothetical protein